MRKLVILLIAIAIPAMSIAQGAFDKFETEKDVTSFIATSKMFKLLRGIEVDTDDPEAQAYLDLINSLQNIKVFMTENPEVGGRMDAAVKSYLSSNSKLGELMRVNKDGKTVRFYSKDGKTENFVTELLMHMNGNVDGKDMTVILSLTGDINLKMVSQLTKDLKVPGSEELKNINGKH